MTLQNEGRQSREGLGIPREWLALHGRDHAELNHPFRGDRAQARLPPDRPDVVRIDAEEEGPYFRALLEGFRELGYVDGPNIKLEHRFPNEMPERFRSMAAELVSLNVSVLVSVGNVASPYAKNATSLDELERAFDAMAAAGMQAVTVNPEGLPFQGRALIAKLALTRRLALCAYSRETFEPGALMSYGTDQIAVCRRSALYVDKILKGTKPGELPVEGPTKFEFLINLKTAKALGLAVPPIVLVRADEVIE